MKRYILSLLVAIGLIGSAAAQVTGLVGEWNFSGNANDTSGNENNCTVFNAALTADRFGNLNSAYHFIGVTSLSEASYISTDSHYNLPTGQSDLTVNLWASVQQPISGDWRVFFSNGQWDNFQLALGAGPYDTKRIQYWTGEGLPQISTDQLVWNDSEWYMITLTVEGGIVNFYRNGINLSTVDVSSYGFGNMGSGDALNLTFGGRKDLPSTLAHPWIGNLDDVSIYNTALSSSQVSSLYTLQSAPEPSTYALFGIGAIGLLMVMRRKKTA